MPKAVCSWWFFFSAKEATKSLEVSESRIKNNQWDRISFDDFYFVQKMVETQMFYEETHVYIMMIIYMICIYIYIVLFHKTCVWFDIYIYIYLYLYLSLYIYIYVDID